MAALEELEIAMAQKMIRTMCKVTPKANFMAIKLGTVVGELGCTKYSPRGRRYVPAIPNDASHCCITA